MRFLIDSLIKYRDSFALAMFLAGVPFVYYLRDGLGLAPGNSLFAMVLIFSPLLFSFSFKDYKFIQVPNRLLYTALSWMLILFLAYCLLRDPIVRSYNLKNELLVYIMFSIVAICLLFMKQSAIDRPFVIMVLVLSFIGSAVLIIYILQNPFYVIGQRATFGYGDDTLGNPHVSSKGAFFGIVASVLALKHYKSVRLGFIIPLVIGLSCIVVLLLTQTMLAFLATFLFFVAFLIFNGSLNNLYLVLKTLFTKWYLLLILVAGTITVGIQINKNKDLIDPAIHYIEVRVKNLKESFLLPQDKKSEDKGDASAATRIFHFSEVFERLEENINTGYYHKVLFGNGYKFMYIDIPHLETLDSFGIVGFSIYTIVFMYIIILCIKEVRNPRSVGTEFLAYIIIYYIVANFTAGQLIDHYRISTYYIIARFLK